MQGILRFCYVAGLFGLIWAVLYFTDQFFTNGVG